MGDRRPDLDRVQPWSSAGHPPAAVSCTCHSPSFTIVTPEPIRSTVARGPEHIECLCICVIVKAIGIVSAVVCLLFLGSATWDVI